MKRSVSDKYVDIFTWYESDLDEVKEIYERHKVEKQGIKIQRESQNRRCCCYKMPPTAGQNLFLLPPLHPGNKQGCLQENSVMQYTPEA